MAFTTRRSMLSRIIKGDEVGWDDFYAAYKPLIRLRGGDWGLSDFEKEGLVQDTVASIFEKESVFKYDKTKGRFRGFLRGIIDKKAVDIIRRRPGERPGEDEAFDGGADESHLDRQWDAEWRSHILKQAFAELREKTNPREFQAFELYCVSDWAPERVAELLDISKSSVYVAKNRCLMKLRKIIAGMEEM